MIAQTVRVFGGMCTN